MSDDELLPGEFDADQQRAAMKEAGLRLMMETAPDLEDDYLARTIAIFHEEWERRFGEKWVLEAGS